MEHTKDVAYYRRLPYTRRVELRTDNPEGPYYLAYLQEMPGLRIDGSTPEEALLKLDQTFDDWIESMLELGDEIPEPEQWPGQLWEQTPLPLSSQGNHPEALSYRRLDQAENWEVISNSPKLALSR